jgi:adenylate kinase family enzyme
MKAIVIGSPGAGKSTFARGLRDITGVPLFYLDMIFHRPDRTTVGRDEFDRELGRIVTLESWIIDGNYRRTLPMRFEAAEKVFHFDLPTEECLRGAAARIGTNREDLPWVERELDPDFRQYIIDFPRDQKPKIDGLISQYRHSREIIIFKSRAEADYYLKSM